MPLLYGTPIAPAPSQAKILLLSPLLMVYVGGGGGIKSFES